MTLRAEVEEFLLEYGAVELEREDTHTEFMINLAGVLRTAWVGFEQVPFIAFGFVIDEFCEEDIPWLVSVSSELDGIGGLIFYGAFAEYRFIQHILASSAESILRDIFQRAERDIGELLNCFAAAQEVTIERASHTIM